MSYLAFNAAPIEEDTHNNANYKKRITRNKTLKKNNISSNGRVADIISQIHKTQLSDDENEMGDFNLPLPESAGSQRKADTEIKESSSLDQSQDKWQVQGHIQGQYNGLPAWQDPNTSYAPANYISSQYKQNQQPKQQQQGDEPVNIDGFKNLENSSHDGSSQFLHKIPYYNQMSLGGSVPNRDELLTKLNYMIHILEEQQDQKTGHVTEEVVLYSFLGIFIIFVIDSFARAGKYVR
jgi:hypothetical protein